MIHISESIAVRNLKPFFVPAVVLYQSANERQDFTGTCTLYCNRQNRNGTFAVTGRAHCQRQVAFFNIGRGVGGT